MALSVSNKFVISFYRIFFVFLLCFFWGSFFLFWKRRGYNVNVWTLLLFCLHCFQYTRNFDKWRLTGSCCGDWLFPITAVSGDGNLELLLGVGFLVWVPGDTVQGVRYVSLPVWRQGKRSLHLEPCIQRKITLL